MTTKLSHKNVELAFRKSYKGTGWREYTKLHFFHQVFVATQSQIQYIG